jgi:hypothetical protein
MVDLVRYRLVCDQLVTRQRAESWLPEQARIRGDSRSLGSARHDVGVITNRHCAACGGSPLLVACAFRVRCIPVGVLPVRLIEADPTCPGRGRDGKSDPDISATLTESFNSIAIGVEQGRTEMSAKSGPAYDRHWIIMAAWKAAGSPPGDAGWQGWSTERYHLRKQLGLRQ